MPVFLTESCQNYIVSSAPVFSMESGKYIISRIPVFSTEMSISSSLLDNSLASDSLSMFSSSSSDMNGQILIHGEEWNSVKPSLHLSVFAKNRWEQIANMISANGCLRVFSIFGNTFSHSREKAVFWVREKRGENSFLHFLNILLANRRKCKPCQWFLVNIRSKYSFAPPGFT